MKYLNTLLILLVSTIMVKAQTPENKLCPTPPMGFISWNLFEGNISETLVREVADAMVSSGMVDMGYEYVILDDLWQGERDENGRIQPDPQKFPNGMKAVADYVHSVGLKFGIYTNVSERTCAGMRGSYGYEREDAQTYAEWGVDYIKCDYCYTPADIFTAVNRYEIFIDEVRATGRDIVFALCEWGQRSPWLWGRKVGAQLWRTTWDLRDIWEHGQYGSGYNGVMESLDRQVGLERYAGDGCWNDPDMLVVGLYGTGKASSHQGATGCSDAEYEAQMSLWSLLAAPLLVTCDVRDMTDETARILMNKEVIAINQDAAGVQATRIVKDDSKEIWAKPLADGTWAIGFLNRDNDDTLEIELDLSRLGMQSASTRDLWKHKSAGEFEGKIKVRVAPHRCTLLKVSSTK